MQKKKIKEKKKKTHNTGTSYYLRPELSSLSPINIAKREIVQLSIQTLHATAPQPSSLFFSVKLDFPILAIVTLTRRDGTRSSGDF